MRGLVSPLLSVVLAAVCPVPLLASDILTNPSLRESTSPYYGYMDECEHDEMCDSYLCVPGPEGPVCSKECGDDSDCEDGWECRGCGDPCHHGPGTGDYCQWCTANCEGKECGSDGCEGNCGECPSGKICNAAGQCEDCQADCEGKECGPDGCNGNCGDCGQYELCGPTGKCTECEPHCNGKECGDDGCGGNCGECQPGTYCYVSVCKEDDFGPPPSNDSSGDSSADSAPDSSTHSSKGCSAAGHPAPTFGLTPLAALLVLLGLMGARRQRHRFCHRYRFKVH